MNWKKSIIIASLKGKNLKNFDYTNKRIKVINTKLDRIRIKILKKKKQ